MFYVDTSVIVAYYCPEPLSDKADAFLTSHGQVAVSSLTEVELFSAVARKVRQKEIRQADGKMAAGKFIDHLDRSMYRRIPLEAHHYVLARDWIGLFKASLRTLDALHLAVAFSEGLIVVTADQGLVKCARELSVKARLLT